MVIFRKIRGNNEPNKICDAANITFAPIMWIKKKHWGTCIVGCITNFVRLMITRQSPCKIIKRTGTFF
jgi:hypothetical protein